MNSALIGLAVAFAVGATTLFYLLVRTIRRSDVRNIRVLAAVSVVVVLAALPGLFETAVVAINRSSGLRMLMVDPSWLVKTVPGAIGLLVALLLNREIGANHNKFNV